MAEPPDPLVPADCDLRDFGYMPLDVLRLRDSEIAAIGDAEAFRAAVIAWCVSWHQLPAASLPDDDAILCRLLGYGRDLKGWQAVRAAGALRGFVRCNDGRLYHHVVAEKARESWAKKQAQRARTEAARAARQKQNANPTATEPEPTLPQAVEQPATEEAPATPTEPVTTSVTGSATSSVTTSVTTSVTGSKGDISKGKGIDRDTSLRSVSPARAAREASDHFADFWQAYPRRVGRAAAERAFRTALARGAAVADIAAGLARQRWPDNPRFIPHPATWLNQERWRDDPNAAAPPEPSRLDYLRVSPRLDHADAPFPDFGGSLGALLQ